MAFECDKSHVTLPAEINKLSLYLGLVRVQVGLQILVFGMRREDL